MELTLTDRTIDLTDEGFDAAFRVGELSDSSLIARSLRPFELMLCAAPAYIEKHGAPSTPMDLQNHACLGFATGELAGQWRFIGPEGPINVSMSSRFVVNNGQALLTAAIAGPGVIFQSTALLRDDVAAGRLVRPLLGFAATPRPMHILYAPDRRITPKLRSFIDFAVSRFGKSE